MYVYWRSPVYYRERYFKDGLHITQLEYLRDFATLIILLLARTTRIGYATAT
jgi:hypothetical protein